MAAGSFLLVFYSLMPNSCTEVSLSIFVPNSRREFTPYVLESHAK
jgi:hypothetical protein